MILAFVPCELGERVSAAYIEVCDVICKLDWYAFPCEMQKLLPFIMVNAQQPVTLKCFGSISCAREVFKRVSIHIDFQTFVDKLSLNQI